MYNDHYLDWLIAPAVVATEPFAPFLKNFAVR
jgi:hypothetical protein